MKDGFVKAAAATPDIRVADVAYNTENICKMIDETVANGAKVIVFPELCVTGYTCSDLFMQDILLKEAKEAEEAREELRQLKRDFDEHLWGSEDELAPAKKPAKATAEAASPASSQPVSASDKSSKGE